MQATKALAQYGLTEGSQAANLYSTSVIGLTISNASLRATQISAAGLLWWFI
jgi:hypothetical protein